MNKRVWYGRKGEADKAKDIESGVVVEMTKGNLGEDDRSTMKVIDVIQDDDGNIEKRRGA